MNHSLILNEVKNEFTLRPDGSSRTTIRGAARLAGVDPSTKKNFSRV